MQSSCPEWTERAMRLNPAEMLSRKGRSRTWPPCNRVEIPDTAVGCSHTILDTMDYMDRASGNKSGPARILSTSQDYTVCVELSMALNNSPGWTGLET